jgi:hypothetical protein
MRRDMITTHTQHLGILLLEPAVITPERDRLLGSATGEVQHMNGKNHVLFATILTQGNLPVVRRGQRKIMGAFANVSSHSCSFLSPVYLPSLTSMVRQYRHYTAKRFSRLTLAAHHERFVGKPEGVILAQHLLRRVQVVAAAHCLV